MDDGAVTIKYDGTLDLDSTFDCGQCFRFSRDAESGVWSGVVRGRLWSFHIPEPGILKVRGCTEAEARHFLMLDVDYDAIASRILEPLTGDERSFMEAAIEEGRGIRILRQETFETLCSFILSQNNNIPRIKRLVESLCESYGEPFVDDVGVTRYAFPTPNALRDAGVEGIFALKTGFRAKYIYDAASAVTEGRIDLNALEGMSTREAVTYLIRLQGVGVKVASCTLLFGCGRLDVFPIDVWIRRALSENFGEGFDPSIFGEYAGVAQQYIFYHKRK